MSLILIFVARSLFNTLDNINTPCSVNAYKAMSKILMYQTKDNRTQIEVQFDKDTVWLNRQQISSLFDRDIKTIGKHIGNVFAEGELEAGSVVAKFATTAFGPPWLGDV